MEGDVALCHDWKEESSVAVRIRIILCGSGSLFSLWCGSGSDLSLWYSSGSGSCSSSKWHEPATTGLPTLDASICERPRPSIFSLYSSWILTLMRIRVLLSMRSDSDPYRSGSATLGTLGVRRVNFSGFPLVLLGEGVHTSTIRAQYCDGTSNIIYCRFRTAPSAPAADLSFQKRNEEVDLSLLAKKRGDFLLPSANILTSNRTVLFFGIQFEIRIF